MSESFFPPPPRPRGRGWWRRLRSLAGFGLLFAVLLGGAIWAMSIGWSEYRHARRLRLEGRQVNCTVVARRIVRHSRSTGCVLTLRRDDTRDRFEREVSSREGEAFPEESKIVFTYEPGREKEGLIEPTRRDRESIWPMFVFGLFPLVFLLLLVSTIVLYRAELRLFRTGVELVTSGTGEEVEIALGDRRTKIRRPGDGGSLVTVVAKGTPAGYVVLASPDFGSHVFPVLGDVDPERLVRRGLYAPMLPLPVRATSPRWNEYVRMKHGSSKFFVRTGVVVLAVAVVLAIVSRWAPGFIAFLGLTVLGEAILLLLWLRRTWGDRALWRHGEEVHATILEKTGVPAKLYRIAYTYRGREYTDEELLGFDVSGWEVPSAGLDPVDVTRVVVLVDPVRPKRWALVPVQVMRHE